MSTEEAGRDRVEDGAGTRARTHTHTRIHVNGEKEIPKHATHAHLRSAYKLDVEGFTLENIVGRSTLPLDFVVTVPVNLHQLPLHSLGQLLWGLVGFRGERLLDSNHAANMEFGIMLSLSLQVCVYTCACNVIAHNSRTYIKR